MTPDILQCIGNAPLLPLRRVAPANGARILLKLESQNPTGSMKDRMALAMIAAAEADGRLPQGGNVVAALRLADRLGPAATIVTVLCDTGMKYLSRM